MICGLVFDRPSWINPWLLQGDVCYLSYQVELSVQGHDSKAGRDFLL